MMKRPYNIIAFALLLTFAFPAQVFAARDEREGGRNQRAQVASARNVDFCKDIDRAISVLDLRFNEQDIKLSESRREQSALLEERKNMREQEKDLSRENWDTLKSEHFSKLFARASTSKQKLAVEKFQTSIEMAVEARRARVDKAVDDFRLGVETIVQARKSSVDFAVRSWKSSRDAAITKAKSDCASGAGSKISRDRFLQSMKAAQEKLQSELSAAQESNKEAKALGEIRNREIQYAIDQFRASVEEATTLLRSAWKDA